MLGDIVAAKVRYIILFHLWFLYMIPYIPAHRASQFYFADK